jgi:pimeloyl-ACP methyl ester carboxylesterase
MRGIADRLASQFQVVALDWLGFGESARPPIDYRAALYHQLLQDFVRERFDRPIAAIAAGHAAGYMMELAQKMPKACSRIVLSAPTWRGPLTSMGVSQPIASAVRQVVRSPIVGQALYQLNTTPAFLRSMYNSHVFANDEHLTAEILGQKWQITQQPGARFAPAAFVTGALDPVCDRSEFLAYFQPLPTPVMVVVGEQAPSSSTAEMEALAKLPGVEARWLPGALGLHEEYPESVVDAALPFLGS